MTQENADTHRRSGMVFLGLVLSQLIYLLAAGVPSFTALLIADDPSSTDGNTVALLIGAMALSMLLGAASGFALARRSDITHWFLVGALFLPVVLLLIALRSASEADPIGILVVGSYVIAGLGLGLGFWRGRTSVLG